MSPLLLSSFFLLPFALSAMGTFFVKRFAIKDNIVDVPEAPRKLHGRSVPLLGGIAIYAAFLISFALLYRFIPLQIPGFTLPMLFMGATILMVGGYLDDRYKLAPAKQIIFPIIACAIAAWGGVAVTKVTNPVGGFIYLGSFAAPLAFIWLLGMSYTTKLLDGLDGLVTGITAIGSLMIFALTMTKQFFQPDIGSLALIFAGALAGFLLWNFPPAKIFLGEGGSLLTGYMLGALAIISGGKIATALLVMGIPVLDAIMVIIRRVVHHQSPMIGDRSHIHFRLLERMTERGAVLVFYAVAAGFGITTLFLQSQQKLIALGILGIAMLGLLALTHSRR